LLKKSNEVKEAKQAKDLAEIESNKSEIEYLKTINESDKNDIDKKNAELTSLKHELEQLRNDISEKDKSYNDLTKTIHDDLPIESKMLILCDIAMMENIYLNFLNIQYKNYIINIKK